MMKIKYYDSFIPLSENEIDKPEDASFFFCKAYTNREGIQTMEGYKITSLGSFYLKKVIYTFSEEWQPFFSNLLAYHKLTYQKNPFTIRYMTQREALFMLKEHHYDEYGKYKSKNILSGQHPWFWEEEIVFDAQNKQTGYTKYILNENLAVIKEQFYDFKGGRLLYEEIIEY